MSILDEEDIKVESFDNNIEEALLKMVMKQTRHANRYSENDTQNQIGRDTFNRKLIPGDLVAYCQTKFGGTFIFVAKVMAIAKKNIKIKYLKCITQDNEYIYYNSYVEPKSLIKIDNQRLFLTDILKNKKEL